jgi:hypothetical protein
LDIREGLDHPTARHFDRGTCGWVEGKHREREVQVLTIGGDGVCADRPRCPPDNAPKDRWLRVLNLDFDEAWESLVLAMDRGDEDVDYLIRIRIVKPVDTRDSARGGLCIRGRCEHETGASKGRRVSRVLFISAPDEHRSHVKSESGNDQQSRQPSGKEDQYLSAF